MRTPLFYNILIKSHPNLKSVISLNTICEYDEWKMIHEYHYELLFPQHKRNDILSVLKFCGVYVEKEVYNNFGMGYFTIMEI